MASPIRWVLQGRRDRARVLGVILTASLASAGIAACGSSSETSSTAAGTAAASATSTAPAGGTDKAASVAYDGPEKDLPMEYPAADTNHDGSCTIGYQNIFAAIPALMVQQKGAQEEAAKLGCKFIALDDQLNPTTQVNNFNQLLAQHADAIVVFPLVPEALGPSVAKAKAAGVHVVANSTPPDAADPLPDGYETRVLQGFDMVAYLRAKYIAETHPGAKVVVMGLAQPVAGLQYFSKRAAYWADRFGLDVLGEVDVPQDNQSSASSAMTQVFSKYPDVEAIFAYNDNTALAAGLAAKTSGKDVAVCGNNGQVNAFKGIKDGTMACSALLDAHDMGIQEALGAYDLITGADVPETVTAKETLVTKDNVDSLTPVG